MRQPGLKVLAVGAVLAVSALLAACDGEDRPTVDVIEDGTGSGTGSGSVSASGTGSVSGSASSSASGAPSTGSAAGAYEPVSNVDVYFAMGADLRDIRAIMQPATEGNAVDWDAASAIFEDGLNQKRADGTVRALAEIPNESVYAVFPNGAAVYGDADFINDLIRAGLNGTGVAVGLSDNARRQIVDKGIQMLLYGKALQEMQAAKTRVVEGNTADADGAPHAVDEAYAAIAGPPADDGTLANGLLATATSREGNFGLEGKLRAPLEQAFVDALEAAREGDADAFEDAHTRVKGYMNGIFYLASLRYAGDLPGDESPEDREVHLAEGGTFFQAIRALVASGSPEAEETIQAAYSRSPDEAFTEDLAQEVYDAMNDDAVLAALELPGDLIVRTPPQ